MHPDTDAPIYLDHHATTPLLPEVVEAMLPYLREHFGNPSSGHAYGLRARAAVEQARAQVADLLGAAPEEIVFTSGGTEACNLAIRGGVGALGPRRVHVITSQIEHPAVDRPLARLETEGHAVTRLPVDPEGLVSAEVVGAVLRRDTALVSLMLANNETGALQPVGAVAAAARGTGVLVHTDASQAVGKVPVRVDALGVDLLSVAGHKLYAPKGVGALYVRRGTRIRPLLLGAGHERGLRPGTESVASLVGLGVACAVAARDLVAEAARVVALRDRLWERLRAAVPGLRWNGPTDPARILPGALHVSFPGVRGAAVLAGAPEVAATTGAACHEGSEQPSAVLTAMGIPRDEALGAVRLSLGRGTTAADVDRAADALVRSWTALPRD
jgi:cysteine desulfurase